MNVKIAPSILAADFAHLADEVKRVDRAGADYIHFDVMDGHFVPNITFGPALVKALKKHCTLPFDVHLMIEPVDPFIISYAEAGADIITVHAEATTHLHRTIQLIKSTGRKAGVSLVPSTHESTIEYILSEVDLVLVMTVNPGFGGQEFIESQLIKIRNIRKMLDKYNPKAELEVDGGINPQTAKKVIEAGANVLVAGTAVFNKNPNEYAANIKTLRS